MDEISKINPMEFYQSLTKEDKTKFLAYLQRTEGFNSVTMSGKLREKPVSHLKYEEGKVLEQVIRSGEWK